MPKRILFLGAAHTQIPPLKYARSQGHYIITCDYLPENPGHKLADECYPLSTTDKDAVLQLAQKLKIDGIVAYASDPAAPTAAYVAECLNLPGNPYESVKILARKDLFRKFLLANGFNVPKSQSFTRKQEAKSWLEELGGIVFVKPVDSSGSKGVTKLADFAEFDSAFDHALLYSREKIVVIEQEIVRSSHQVAGDGFLVDGQLVFRCWADEHFDKLCNGLVPIGQTFPTAQPNELLAVAHRETQRLVSALSMRNGALNFDLIFDEKGNFYFLELGPRNGGCQIPEVIRYATGVDLIKYTVDTALGFSCENLRMKPTDGYWSSYMVHSLADGVFKEIWLSDRIKPKIIEKNIWAQSGEPVKKYTGSNDTLGSMILRFESMYEMNNMIENMEKDIRVICN
jgi:biotin carboxylase